MAETHISITSESAEDIIEPSEAAFAYLDDWMRNLFQENLTELKAIYEPQKQQTPVRLATNEGLSNNTERFI